MGPLAHGSDFAGSVRYPAHVCGVAGIRPTLGRLPGYSGDASEQITRQLMSVQGLLARRVRDLYLGLPVLAERDARAPWWVPAPLAYWRPDRRPLRVGVFRRPPDGVAADPSVLQSIDAAASALERAGYAVEEAAPPHFTEAADLWTPLVMNEIKVTQMPEIQKNGDDAVRNSMAAWLEDTPPLDLAGFSRALGRREQILRDWVEFLQRYPMLVTPASWRVPFPTVPSDLDQRGAAVFREMLAAQSPMLSVAALGLPGLSVPTGVVDGVPTGVQVVAGQFREDLCFEAGEAIERAFPMPTPIDLQGGPANLAAR